MIKSRKGATSSGFFYFHSILSEPGFTGFRDEQDESTEYAGDFLILAIRVQTNVAGGASENTIICIYVEYE